MGKRGSKDTKSGAPGMDGTAQAWNDAAKAAAGNGSSKPPKMQLGFSTRETTEERQQVELPCGMSAGELTHAGAEVARQKGDIERRQNAMAAEKADKKKAWKEEAREIAKLEAEHSKAAREVREQARFRLVPVRVEHDFGLGASRYFRLDRGAEHVGELYDTKAMEPELREKLMKAGAKADKKGKPEPIPVVAAPPEPEDDAPPINSKGERLSDTHGGES